MVGYRDLQSEESEEYFMETVSAMDTPSVFISTSASSVGTPCPER